MNITNLQRHLYLLEGDPINNAIEITYNRGKLISEMKKELKGLNPSDLMAVSLKKRDISMELIKHKGQINNRKIETLKNEPKAYIQIPKEIGLKIRKTAVTISQIVNSETGLERVKHSTELVGNIASAALSVAKIPTLITMKVIEKTLPMLGLIAISPMHMFGLCFSKLINPDSPYNEKTINNIGKGIGNFLAECTAKTAEALKRM